MIAPMRRLQVVASFGFALGATVSCIVALLDGWWNGFLPWSGVLDRSLVGGFGCAAGLLLDFRLAQLKPPFTGMGAICGGTLGAGQGHHLSEVAPIIIVGHVLAAIPIALIGALLGSLILAPKKKTNPTTRSSVADAELDQRLS